ncbi:MAG: DUF3365 domain-containing protein [Croceitalea sp.]|nr:DUF3365 domain-containing protein [Croceitalea sp.]
MKYFFSLALLGLLLTTACKNQKKETYTSVDESEKDMAIFEDGKALMENKCYLCHSPSAPQHEGRIGPPMIAIKAHYLEKYDSEAAFVEAISDFVKGPTEDKVLLKGAVRRFGLMPQQVFDDDEVRKIAAYMYAYEIEEPEWFEAHWNERGGKHKHNPGKKHKKQHGKKQNHSEMGMKYAMETKKVLGANLMGKIQQEGVLQAVKFCNEQAYPLTDSMAQKLNAKIKRVSDKPRNVANVANEEELAHIAHFKEVVAADDKVEPIMVQKGEEVHFYYPIVTNSMCLNCHGNKQSNIEPKVLTTLAELYPKDRATGYDINEVRGIWSIAFTANQ